MNLIKIYLWALNINNSHACAELPELWRNKLKLHVSWNSFRLRPKGAQKDAYCAAESSANLWSNGQGLLCFGVFMPLWKSRKFCYKVSKCKVHRMAGKAYLEHPIYNSRLPSRCLYPALALAHKWRYSLHRNFRHERRSSLEVLPIC